MRFLRWQDLSSSPLTLLHVTLGDIPRDRRSFSERHRRTSLGPGQANGSILLRLRPHPLRKFRWFCYRFFRQVSFIRRNNKKRRAFRKARQDRGRILAQYLLMSTSTETGKPAVDLTHFLSEKPEKSHKSADGLQIKTILVPLDFSRPSMQALKYAIGLAEEFNAAVHLAHVQPTDELTAIAGAGHLMLNCADAVALMQDRLAEVQHEHDVRFLPEHCHVPSGRPYEEICKLARDLNVDLIVLSTRGHSGLKHIVLGSTAERVVRFAPCPVLIPRGQKYRSLSASLVGEAPRFQPRRILVPVDFSECCFVAVKYAARMAARFNSTLRLFHAIYPYVEMMGIDRITAESAPVRQATRANAELEMEALKQSKWLDQIACEVEIRTGYPVDEICSETSGHDVDLVVTATHGRTGFKHALIGSVAEQVVRYAECPVISVPSRFNPDN